ncbi:ATP-binding protein [Leptolyngbya sp. FACHB-36]|uniref:P-loop NTPase fold protein n=1 Tax=Leptolyngbya sp. FACHB-36 TaxID=2692808 RepID=UPI001680DE5A|nr:P-loop NTPase fold protein [Leptolyngbya sp. FACHB-36]MBD2022309.1 ATP-binding protein [Leptolyngbya sp. FACHB-36]
MPINVAQFLKACNPSRTLSYGDPQDRQFYIDFAPVRGNNIIQELKRTIELLPNDRTCQLFTGHVGCGKSTELLRLKAELEELGFYVVYFESSQDLDMSDVDVTDILMAIAHQVSEKLEAEQIKLKPSYFTNLFTEIGEILQTPIEFTSVDFSVGISKITARTKDSPRLRSQLRQYMEPRTNGILRSINDELLGQAIDRLKQRSKRGLVVIIDNLDRVDARQLPSGRTQPEYLFIDRGEQLSKLNCHLVYTIPLALVYSNESETVRQRFGGGLAPKVLPMVPVRQRDGNSYEAGIDLLRQMVFARAFPGISLIQQTARLREVFDSRDTLDRLCLVSGGHVRNLLGLLCNCIQQSDPPFSRQDLEQVIRGQRDALARAIDDVEWMQIFQVVDQQTAKGDLEYQMLLRSMFVFEYQDPQGGWFGINPVLAETKKYQDWSENQSAS